MKENINSNEIINFLEKYGIKRNSIDKNNNQIFFFNYKNLYVHFFVSSDGTFYGEAYKRTEEISETEDVRICRLLLFSSLEERIEFQEETGYRHFIFEGEKERNIKNLITLLKMPIKKVIKIQDNKGTVHIKDKNLLTEYRRKILKEFFNR